MAQPSPEKNSHKLTLKEFLEFLVKAARISVEDATKVWELGRDSQHHPVQVVADKNVTDLKNPSVPWTQEKLAMFLAQLTGKEYVQLDKPVFEDESLSTVIPYNFAFRNRILPLQATEKFIVFATSEPFLTDWIYELGGSLKKKIFIKLVPPFQIEKGLEQWNILQKNAPRVPLPQAGKNNKSLYEDEKIQVLDKMVNDCRKEKISEDESLVAGIVDFIFHYALEERATDIHFEPRTGNGRIRFRIDGDLRTIYHMAMEIMTKVQGRIKVLGNMKVDEKRRPQDGRIRVAQGEKVEMGEMDLRLSTIPTFYGEKMVIRISDPGTMVKNFNELGFYPDDIKAWKHFLSLSYGLILVTGPTGSGKTTTLYTSLKSINKPALNICTVEDPVEIVDDNFNQVQVHAAIDVTFENVLRAFMRQDPDIIMVGEIRDKATGEMCVQAALTGHLVLSTVHTNSSLATITRLMDLGIPPYLLNAACVAILNQRLIKVLCPLCKEKKPPSPSVWSTLLGTLEAEIPPFVFGPVGCSACKMTGFKGRVCLYELLPITENLKASIRPNVELTDLEKDLPPQFRTLRKNALQRVLEGVTSMEEALENLGAD